MIVVSLEEGEGKVCKSGQRINIITKMLVPIRCSYSQSTHHLTLVGRVVCNF